MRVICAVAALVLIAAGCSSDRESDAVATTDGATVPLPTLSPGSIPPGSGVAVDTPPLDTTTGEMPAGSQLVELPDLGVRFAAPETYTPLVPTELGTDFYESDSFTELAERLEFDSDVFAQSLRESLAVFLFAPAQPEGYIDNVSVSSAPDEPLPDSRSISDALEPLDATDVVVEPVDLDGTAVMTSTYTRAGADGALFGRDVIFEAGAGLVTIGITAATEGEADVVADLVIETLVVGTT